MISLDRPYIESIVRMALGEDTGSGDITTLLTIPVHNECDAQVLAKEEGVLAGIDVAEMAFKITDPACEFERFIDDGALITPGNVIAKVKGSTRGVLIAERVALNFLQHMSGVATETRKYVAKVEGTKARIVDTRKTTPGLRRLEKYAVRMGGGYNHRFNLADGILIKDNHIRAVGGIEEAVRAAVKDAPHTLEVEVEVTSVDEVNTAMDAGAKAVLLDNMTCDMMRQAVEIADGKVLLEASGGINLANVAEVAATGVDIISVGAITHSSKSLDISLDVKN